MADTDYLAASDGTGDAALMHVTSPRVALATIIQVDTVVGVPAFFIGTWGTLLASGFIDPTTKRDFFGHVNAGTLVIDKMAPGNTDGGNTTGQVVVIKPSTPTQNLIGNYIKTATNLFSEGELLNGKLVPSITSNNLVVSLKTLNGVDPSTTDVVYVRIGDTIRSITAALSVTLAAGTNWFSKGTAPLATVATNFFVYLGWNATDGVTLGLSSTASAYRYSDFSTTNTDWTYAKISNVAHAASTDVYENVGRINAILGVTATFLWTLPANNLAISQPSREVLQYPVRVQAYRSAALTSPAGGLAGIVLDAKLMDIGNNFNTTTGLFTAPVTGNYHISVLAAYTMGGTQSGYGSNILKNGVNAAQFIDISPSGTAFSATAPVSKDIFLAVGDTIQMGAYGSGVAMAVGATNCYMDIHLINAI